MSWEQITIMSLLAISILGTVSEIGKPRKPITPNIAIGSIVVNTILIILVARI